MTRPGGYRTAEAVQSREVSLVAEVGMLLEDAVALIVSQVIENHPVWERRFIADEYPRTVEAGILHEDDRVELIVGEILGTGCR